MTAYRQLVQQYAKDVNGNTVAPKVAVGEANATFRANPIGASLSGLWPRLIGVLLKRVPKFGFLLGYSHFVGEGTPGFAAATCASICSAPFINPVRLVEKQQRAYFKQTGQAKPVGEILRESAAKNFLPLFRGTIPLMGHSLAGDARARRPAAPAKVRAEGLGKNRLVSRARDQFGRVGRRLADLSS